MKPAAFLDRDGVLNKEKGYVFDIKDFEWITSAAEAIKFLNQNNFYVFVVTNQSGIGKGLYSEMDVKNLHKFMNKELQKKSAYIDDFFYSPYHPDGISHDYDHLSNLRKPDVGMLQLAFNKWSIDKDKSFMIGDSESDILCANRFGIKSYLFRSNNLFDFVRENIKI